TLSFPSSVVQFFQGHLGEPYGGYPEPFRSRVLKDQAAISGRPGASLGAFDFATLKQQLIVRYGSQIRDVDVISAALYPEVFAEYMQFHHQYSDVSKIPTRNFLAPLTIGEEIYVEIEH